MADLTNRLKVQTLNVFKKLWRLLEVNFLLFTFILKVFDQVLILAFNLRLGKFVQLINVINDSLNRLMVLF